jgi:hypothetical protein
MKKGQYEGWKERRKGNMTQVGGRKKGRKEGKRRKGRKGRKGMEGRTSIGVGDNVASVSGSTGGVLHLGGRVVNDVRK